MPYIKLHRACIDYPLASHGARANGRETKVGGRIFERQGRQFVRALDRVSLNLRDGARVGLLGGNGSGKSTLLRTLAGILPISQGMRSIDGRVTTLFAIGVGMDLHKTGVENIARMAALHNIPRDRIPSLVEDIAEFSELGEFMTLPVKTYSAGMRARLGFGFVTALESDIVLIDEVIGTGDRNFHEKARKRMSRFIERRGIVVLASHSMSVLNGICTHGIVMRTGRVAFEGKIADAAAFFEGGPQATAAPGE